MNSPSSLRGFTFTLLLLASLPGCARVEEEAVADGVVTSALSVHDSEGMGKEVADPRAAGCAVDPESAARAIAARPSAAFVPSSCVEKTADGNVVDVALHDCSGRLGKGHVSGSLEATLTAAADCRLRAEISGNPDLTANGHPLEYQASAEVEVHEDADDVSWQAEWSGTTPRGRSIHQTTDVELVAEHDTGCIDATGHAQGEISGHAYEIHLDGVAVCPDACPSRGTVEAQVEGYRREREMTVTFDGSRSAHVVGFTGREFDVEMECTAAE